MPEAFSIRPYRQGDEEALCALYGRVFGSEMSVAHWLWKLKAPDSPAENVFLAEHDGRVVGQYAGIPSRLLLFGRETWTMFSVDIMVDPEFRRRGVVTRFGEHVFGIWREAGLEVLLGVPNKKWGSRKKALDIRPWFELERRALLLRPEAFLARKPGLGWLRGAGGLGAGWRAFAARKLTPDPGVRTRVLDRAEDALDRVWERCAGDAELSIVRDARRADWRFFAPPDEDYDVFLAERDGEPVGYAAARLKTRPDGLVRGWIAEVVAPRADPDARRALLRDVVDHLQAAGAHMVLVSALEGAPELELYRRWGFGLRRPPIEVHLAPIDEDLPLDKVRDPSRWIMSAGDFDHY